jgi:hypothetical protein
VGDFAVGRRIDEVPVTGDLRDIEEHLDDEHMLTRSPSSESGMNSTLVCRSGAALSGDRNRHSV